MTLQSLWYLFIDFLQDIEMSVRLSKGNQSGQSLPVAVNTYDYDDDDDLDLSSVTEGEHQKEQRVKSWRWKYRIFIADLTQNSSWEDEEAEQVVLGTEKESPGVAKFFFKFRLACRTLLYETSAV